MNTPAPPDPTPSSTKHTLCRVAQSVHLAALGVWCGAVATSGIAAAIIFPTFRELDPTLGQYPDYAGDHALLGAGRVAGSIFFAVDLVQFVCGMLVLMTLITMLLTGYALRTLLRVVRSVLTLATLGLLSYHLVILMPEMSQHLSAYWSNATQGNTEHADVARDAFLAMHSTASNVLKGLTLMTLVCVLLAGFTTIDERDHRVTP